MTAFEALDIPLPLGHGISPLDRRRSYTPQASTSGLYFLGEKRVSGSPPDTKLIGVS